MFTHNRNEVSLNGTWKFNPDPYQRCRQQKWWVAEGPKDGFFPCFNLEGLWDIEVPGTWKCQHPELKWYDGHANYVKEFDLDEIPHDQEAFLCFDGVIYEAEVYLNGQAVGVHKHGYSPFQMRVTDMLAKRNRLFVLVDNIMREDRVPGIRCDWNNDGGIVNGVKLIFVPRTYIENFRTSTRIDGDTVIIEATIWLVSRDVTATESVEFAISELGISATTTVGAGESATVVLTIPKEEMELWRPADPKLYRTEVRTRHETIGDDIGYREIRTQGTQILLNGEAIQLYGVAVHSEFPETGRSSTAEGIARMLAKARELGCNFLRCAHYPYSDDFARTLDREGMLWWEEVPVYWLPFVHREPQCSLALGMLRDMVRRDWNRAGLIFWSVSNECAGDGTDICTSLEQGNYPYWVKACALVRELDPSRLISSADSGYRRTAKSNWTPDAGDAFDTDLDSTCFLPGHPDGFYELLDVLGANLYVGHPGGNPAITDKWVGMLRPYNKPLMITEFGSMSTADDPGDHGPEETGHPAYHEAILREGYRACHAHPEIVGTVPWCLMDVRVPMHWRWYNRGSATFAYGLLDNNYNDKPAFNVVKEEIIALKQARIATACLLGARNSTNSLRTAGTRYRRSRP